MPVVTPVKRGTRPDEVPVGLLLDDGEEPEPLESLLSEALDEPVPVLLVESLFLVPKLRSTVRSDPIEHQEITYWTPSPTPRAIAASNAPSRIDHRSHRRFGLPSAPAAHLGFFSDSGPLSAHRGFSSNSSSVLEFRFQFAAATAAAAAPVPRARPAVALVRLERRGLRGLASGA